MREQRKPITKTQARQSLHALGVLSGKVTEPPKPKNKLQQHESKIQQALFEWAAYNTGKYPELRLLFHIVNEGKRNAVSGYHLKQQGMKKGLPDLCLPVARGQYHGLYIELKSESGRLQETQKQWIDDLNKQGYKAVVCFGFDEAVAAITDYLSMKQKRLEN